MNEGDERPTLLTPELVVWAISIAVAVPATSMFSSHLDKAILAGLAAGSVWAAYWAYGRFRGARR